MALVVGSFWRSTADPATADAAEPDVSPAATGDSVACAGARWETKLGGAWLFDTAEWRPWRSG